MSAGHDRSTVIFHGTLTDSEFYRDVFTRMARQYHVHDLSLPEGQVADAMSGLLSPGQLFIRVT